MSSANISLTVLEPKPVLSGITPSTITPGIASDAVISGQAFDSSSTVILNGTAQPTVFLSPQSLSIHIDPMAAGSPSANLAVMNDSARESNELSVPIGITYDAASRFLQQASWGATPPLVAHVQQVGFQGYLTEQFASSEDTYYTDTDFQHVPENLWWATTFHEQSQLRTKVGWAWYKLFNSPGSTVIGMLAAVPNLTNREAFGSYQTLLSDISLNIEMGLYFNYCCFDRAEAVSGSRPDENFGRELMQQFTIGPYSLNADGTNQLDKSGNPIPASTQADVLTLARSMTGLSYSGNPYDSLDPEGLVPMISGNPNDHDTSSKVLLGQNVPGGLDAASEVLLVTGQLAANANTGRHLSKYLIHELVTSNPSPAYVKRVAAVWADDGTHRQGNLQAVVQAILLDPEARAGDDPEIALPQSAGRFRDSINYETSLMRQFGAQAIPGIPLVGPAEAAATLSHEGVFSAPSVFGYYSDYNTTGTGLLAPEAQLYTSDALLARATFSAYVFGLPGAPNPSQPSIDWSQWEPLAQGEGATLLDTWNHLCFHGRMSPELRAALQSNLQAIPDTDLLRRVEQTAYLIVMSPEYMVEN